LSHPLFTPSGAWTFLSGLLRTFWRGEFVWQLKRLADPVIDGIVVLSSVVFLGVAAWTSRRRKADVDERTADVFVWSAVVLSVLCLAWLSISFEYGQSFYPSQQEPFFTSGRLIAGICVPFFALYVRGLTWLTSLTAARARRAPIVLVVLLCLAMTVSEISLTWPIFASPYNWFHLP
jgi:hypothetical protein